MRSRQTTAGIIGKKLMKTHAKGDMITLADVRTTLGGCDTSARTYMLVLRNAGIIDGDGVFDPTILRDEEITIRVPKLYRLLIDDAIDKIIDEYDGLVKREGED